MPDDVTGYADDPEQTTSNSTMSSLSDGTNTFDVLDKNALHVSGGTMSGAIDMGANSITNLSAPADNTDAATKKYVDDAIATAIASLATTEQVDSAITQAVSGITLESLGGGSADSQGLGT